MAVKRSTDPLTGKRLSEECWNGFHEGYKPALSKDDKRRKAEGIYKPPALCTGYAGEGLSAVACECLCHQRAAKKPARRADQGPTLGDVYGTIKV